MDSGQHRRQRLFIALYPEIAERKVLHGLAVELAQKSGGRAVPEANLHITLKFLGPVDGAQLACLEQALDRVQAGGFTLRFDRLEYRRRQRMWWTASDECPQALDRLAKEVERAVSSCGFAGNEHRFLPHLTLTRSSPKGRGPDTMTPVEFRVDQFHLLRSETLPEGSRYTRLRSWPLLAPATQ